MNADISLQEALFGYEGEFTHLDGHKYHVNSVFNKVTQPFSWNIIRGEGMPKKGTDGEFGDLHVKLLINFPAKLSER